MPQQPGETVQQWQMRALREATEADNAVRPYVVEGTEHSADGPVTPEHQAAVDRWRAAQADLDAADKALQHDE